MGDDAALEERPVAGEDDPPLAGCRRDELLVREPIGVGGVEPEEPQVPSELPEVAIEEERDPAEGLPPHREEPRHIEALELRVHGQPVAQAEPRCEVHRLAVEEHELHLDVRDAEGLDHVLDRWGPLEGVGDRLLAPSRREEIVQLPVHADGGTGHGSLIYPSQGRRKMAFARSTWSTVSTIWFFSTVQ